MIMASHFLVCIKKKPFPSLRSLRNKTNTAVTNKWNKPTVSSYYLRLRIKETFWCMLRLFFCMLRPAWRQVNNFKLYVCYYIHMFQMFITAVFLLFLLFRISLRVGKTRNSVIRNCLKISQFADLMSKSSTSFWAQVFYEYGTFLCGELEAGTSYTAVHVWRWSNQPNRVGVSN